MKETILNKIRRHVNPHATIHISVGTLVFLILLIGVASIPYSYSSTLRISNDPKNYSFIIDGHVKDVLVEVSIFGIPYDGNISIYGRNHLQEQGETQILFQEIQQKAENIIEVHVNQDYDFIYGIILLHVNTTINEVCEYKVTIHGLPRGVYLDLFILISIFLILTLFQMGFQDKPLDYKMITSRFQKTGRTRIPKKAVFSYELKSFNYGLFYGVLFALLFIYSPLNIGYLSEMDFTEGAESLSEFNANRLFILAFMKGVFYDFQFWIVIAITALLVNQVQTRYNKRDQHEKALIPVTIRSQVTRVVALFSVSAIPVLGFLALIRLLLQLRGIPIHWGWFLMALLLIALILLSFSMWYYAFEIWSPPVLKLLLPMLIYLVFFEVPRTNQYKGIGGMIIMLGTTWDVLLKGITILVLGSLILLLASVLSFKHLPRSIEKIILSYQ